MAMIAIDTSNRTLSVAVKTDTVCVEKILQDRMQHSVTLLPTIEQAMREAGITTNQLEGVIVTQGPGSYTGLRIGVMVAKTMAYGLNIPLFALSSLKALASNIIFDIEEPAYIVPFFDARRQTIFTGIYFWDGNTLQIHVNEQHITWQEWLNVIQALDRPVYFVGEMAPNVQEEIVKQCSPQVRFISESGQVIQASRLFDWITLEDKVDVDTFIPVYLKRAEAEEIWMNEHPDLKEKEYVERISNKVDNLDMEELEK